MFSVLNSLGFVFVEEEFDDSFHGFLDDFRVYSLPSYGVIKLLIYCYLVLIFQPDLMLLVEERMFLGVDRGVLILGLSVLLCVTGHT